MHDSPEHCHGPDHRHHHMKLPGFVPDENTPQADRSYLALRDASRAMKQALMKRLAEKDAHPGQAVCLWALSAKDGMSQAELAEVLGIARPTVTTMLQKMEKSGLVERRVDTEDQRYTRIYLTDAGRAQYEDLQAVRAQLVDSAMERLTHAELVELERLLVLVTENIEKGLA